MDCAGVASQLVAYHFATATDAERDAIDAHLLGCRPCLETYLALKRATDRGPLEKPSASVRARLRAEVAETFRPAPRVGLMRRRIPLYQGLFAAAVAAAIALAVPSLLRSGPRAPLDAREGAPRIDSARPSAESLQIY